MNLDNKKDAILPTSKSDKELANSFFDLVQRKNILPQKVATENPNAKINLSVFEPATADGIKCSPEDPVPVELLSSNMDTFIPIGLEIINLSLEIGSMESLKGAVILPLLKELGSTIDTNNFKNYRPVSNLMFISKLAERIVEKMLDQHMAQNNLMIDKQYGYKKAHSTEMLLLKVVNDLFQSFDKNILSVVILLDLSVAFDTVDHLKLLEILHKEIGVTSVALKWFKSFLTNWTQKVKIGSTYSNLLELLYSVAQGSVLGPHLLKRFTSDHCTNMLSQLNLKLKVLLMTIS